MLERGATTGKRTTSRLKQVGRLQNHALLMYVDEQGRKEYPQVCEHGMNVDLLKRRQVLVIPGARKKAARKRDEDVCEKQSVPHRARC